MKLYILITNPGYRGEDYFSHIPPKHFPGPLFSLSATISAGTLSPNGIARNFRGKVCGLMKNSVTEFFWVCVASSRKITFKLNCSHGLFGDVSYFLGES
ncbi:hypothetical protein CEXT_467241 [Caerostris extrusa]|uniref:Uncharacterized protein n=1 Tax=Caerostris extrusa TaxID=172846 RepID=A0AAV4X400_CAEEX|nr:hypothetical protein CEXT_467241 [Caerostris extrusa]